MNTSIISWTNRSWNPVHGCSKVSSGCRNCYAERLSLQKGFTKLPWTPANAAGNVQEKPHKLAEPSRLKEPSRIFVNSMSDLFHEAISDEYRARIFSVMESCPQHVFQVLTKRSERLGSWPGPWLDNIWMGVSVENKATMKRIDDLRGCGASIKFVSCEPLLEPIPHLDLSGIDWLIVGGESGPGFRPMNHEWVWNMRDLCISTGTAFFFKQSSAYRTELGTSLQHEDGAFWSWQQYPGKPSQPTPADSHKYIYRDTMAE